MKVSEITEKDVVDLARIDDDATDRGLIGSLFLPAAIEHIREYCGLSDEEMDKHPDLSIAVCALCAHMYDNRSVTGEGQKENRVVREIVEKYSMNFIPKGASA